MRKSSPGGHQAWNHWFSYRFDRFLIGSREGARMRKSSPGGHQAWNHRFSYRFVRFLLGSREGARMKKSSPGGIWEASGSYLRDILEPSGSHLGAEGSHLGAIWKHLGAIWKTSGGHLGGLGPQGAPKVVWGGWDSKKCYPSQLESTFSSKSIKKHWVFEGTIDFLLIFTMNLSGHSTSRRSARTTGPLSEPPEPLQINLFGEIPIKYSCIWISHGFVICSYVFSRAIPISEIQKPD